MAQSNVSRSLLLRSTLRSIALLSISGSLLFCAKLTAAPVLLKMGVHNFPPDIVVNADGSCAEPGLALSQRIFADAGMQVEPVCINPARMFMLLEHHIVEKANSRAD